MNALLIVRFSKSKFSQIVGYKFLNFLKLFYLLFFKFL